ncbi:MAG: hypothetical protein IPH07_13095 [Deltaproteobacteria bacterium]|nr:hypothetical protein [Deltaproteobacteria bacterium]MBK8716990.1 hypothetical protein [Deltaproteobacteria bacterium]
MQLPARLALSLGMIAATACQRLDVEGGEGSVSVTAGDASSSGGETGPNTDSDASASASDADTSGDGGMTELDCDPVLQSGCSEDQKCTVVLQAGDPTYTCVIDDEDLDPFGSCTPALGTGVDGCPAGYACLSPEDGDGICTPLCLKSSDCPSGVCLAEDQHAIQYCAQECSPFNGDCIPPLSCRRTEDRFACSFPHADDVGGQAEPCTSKGDAGCGQGYVCLPGALVPECVADNCCTSVCDLDADSCVAPATCNTLFEAPAPGSEFIGACFVPS